MQTYDVQSVSLAVPAETAYRFIAEPRNLTQWAAAFKEADGVRALLATPAGQVRVALKTAAAPAAGTVDWIMTFPDGTVGTAHSRVVPDGEERSIFVFVLHAPPVPLSQIEGTLAQQKLTLAEELRTLKQILER